MTTNAPADSAWWLVQWRELNSDLASTLGFDAPRLTVGAMIVAAHQCEFVRTPLQLSKELERLDDCITAAASRMREGDSFDRWHFVCTRGLELEGDTHTYHDPANSFLPQILRRKRGLPIGLAVIWLHAASRLGVDAYGVGLPGHFLIGIGDPQQIGTSPLYIDGFHAGKVLTIEQAHALYESMFITRSHPPFTPEMLAPVTNEAIWTRMIANLKQEALRRRDFATLTDLARLRWELPNPTLDDGRELVRLCVATGAAAEAAACLTILMERFAHSYPAGLQRNDRTVVSAALN